MALDGRYVACETGTRGCDRCGVRTSGVRVARLGSSDSWRRSRIPCNRSPLTHSWRTRADRPRRCAHAAVAPASRRCACGDLPQAGELAADRFVSSCAGRPMRSGWRRLSSCATACGRRARATWRRAWRGARGEFGLPCTVSRAGQCTGREAVGDSAAGRGDCAGFLSGVAGGLPDAPLRGHEGAVHPCVQRRRR